MAFTFPTTDDFKAYFVRDFPYGTDPANNVLDSDISSALNDAEMDFPQFLFGTQQMFTTACLNLAAHWLYLNLKAAGGLSGQPNWIQTAKAVGNVSESFQVPQRIMDNPEFAMLSQTFYGKKYLFIVLPLLSGQMYTVAGRTKS